uniref:U42-Liphistoxin-Lth1a_1 n=1 Tax=Liphistius thaleban TaxID=1905330 RepID=A0A4Q8K2V7_9ARAC
MLILSGLLPCLVAAVCVVEAVGQEKRIYPKGYRERSFELVNEVEDTLSKGDKKCKCPPHPLDCAEVLQCGKRESGIYEIWPRNRIISESVYVYCDMKTDGGGWTVIQRRGNYGNRQDYFFKKWVNYKNGFGNPEKDFWLGNDKIYALTNQNQYTLRFDLMDFENNLRTASYKNFWIESENNQYRLHVSNYVGDAGDSFIEMHGGQKFSTKDRDNDNSTDNCATTFKGGWWYSSCLVSNLNGLYLLGKHKSDGDGIEWSSWKGRHESLKKTEMKIRPLNYIISEDLNLEGIIQ